MGTYKLSQRSKDKLVGVHPKLVAVVERAIEITDRDFMVLEGLRTPERQKEMVASGKSKTLNSRHLTGRAVDLAVLRNGKVTWVWEEYEYLAGIMKQAAAELGVKIIWGGDWEKFRDGVHFELAPEVK